MIEHTGPFGEYLTNIEYTGACILCGTVDWGTFCESCLPKVTVTGVCLLCRSRHIDKDPKFCNPCRRQLGDDSEADGARFMRQLQQRFSRCEKDNHLLGLLPCYCEECKTLQPSWELCAECLTIRSSNYKCKCGKTAPNFTYDTPSACRTEPQHLEKLLIRKSDGNPIHADEDAEVWRELRNRSVGASDAMKLIKQNGEKRTSFATVLAQKQSGEVDEHFWSFDHGIQREPLIAQWIQINLPQYELIPNRYVYGGEDIRHTATPDMVGPDYLAEIKTSTKPLRQTLTRYYDQLQWQMHVTNYESVLFVVENRATQEIEHDIVQRDSERIKLLVDAANELLEHL
jgi:hypothetical protein